MVSRLTFHTAEKTHPKPLEVRRDLRTSASFAAGAWRRTGDSPRSPPTGTRWRKRWRRRALRPPGPAPSAPPRAHFQPPKKLQRPPRRSRRGRATRSQQTPAAPQTPSFLSPRLGRATTLSLREPAAWCPRAGEPRAHASSTLASVASGASQPKPWPSLSPGRRPQNECPPPPPGGAAVPRRPGHGCRCPLGPRTPPPTPAAPAYLN